MVHIIDNSKPCSPDISPEPSRYIPYTEVPVAIFINGRHATTVLLTPGDQKEYLTGFLLNEQYVDSLDEIESIRVEQNRISALTTNIFTRPEPKKTILSGCGGAVSYIDTAKLPVILPGFSISGTGLETGISQYLRRKDILRKGPVDACVWKDGDLLLEYDMGEEQVIDRIIGAALARKIDLSSSCLIFSGTITSETVRKCLVTGIPLILTTQKTTRLASEIGAKNGICIGIISGDDLVVCSHPEYIQD